MGSVGHHFLQSLGITVPLTLSNISNEEELFEDWTSLILANPSITSWVFKIDEEGQGNSYNQEMESRLFIFKK